MSNPNVRIEERGNAVVITLVLLVILAGAAGAFFLAKKGVVEVPGLDVASSDEASEADAQAQTPEGESNPVIAVVDGKKINRQEVIDMMNAVPPQLRQLPPEQLFPMVLEQMINNHIIDKKASKAGLEKDKDVKEQLAKVKEQIIRAKFLENALEENLSEDRIREEYDAYVKMYKPEQEMRASHILVSDEKVAKDIIKKLNDGTAFEELAKENSIDGTAQTGGDLGYFTKGEVVPEFAEAAFALEDGAYTRAPVKSNFGFHVIKAGEKRERKADSYEDMKPVIVQNLRRVVYDEVLQKWKEESTVERFDINGNPLAQEEPAAGEGDSESQDAEATVDAEDGKAKDAASE